MTDRGSESDSEHSAEKNTLARDESLRELIKPLTTLASEVRSLRNLLEDLRLQQYVQALLNRRRIAWVSFSSGVLNGLGAVIGATLVLALLLYILSRLEVVPYIGRFVSEIVKIVQQQKP